MTEIVYGTRREADRRLAEIRVAVREDASPTVGYVWERYVLPGYLHDLKKGRKKPQTIRQYLGAWKGSVGPRWADVPLSALKPRDVQDWLLGQTHGAGQKALILLRAVTAKAAFLEIIDHDPLAKPYQLAEKVSRPRDVPNLAALAGVWEVCRGTWVEPLYLFCAHAGLRVGESVAVRLEDLAWDESGEGLVALVHVRRQITDKQEVLAPKYDSVRWTAMPDPWASRLREIVGGLREGAEWVMDDGASDPGDPPVRRRATWRWRQVFKGTPWEGLRLQLLRPAFETYMHWELDVPQSKVSKMMGHKSEQVTKVYDRPGDAEVRAMALEVTRGLPLS